MTVGPTAGTPHSGEPAAIEQPKLRADARRNRDRIVAAATVMFGEHGPDVPLEDIARAAGVGTGTLYRRFPDRRSLVLAVVRESLETLLSKGRLARERQLTAWDRLVGTLEHTNEVKIALHVASAVLGPTAEALRSDPEVRLVRAELVQTLETALREAQDERSVRADVGPGDIARLFGLLMRDQVSTPATPAERVAHERVRALILDGLRCTSCAPLPGHAPSMDGPPD